MVCLLLCCILFCFNLTLYYSISSTVGCLLWVVCCVYCSLCLLVNYGSLWLVFILQCNIWFVALCLVLYFVCSILFLHFFVLFWCNVIIQYLDFVFFFVVLVVWLVMFWLFGVFYYTLCCALFLIFRLYCFYLYCFCLGLHFVRMA